MIVSFFKDNQPLAVVLLLILLLGIWFGVFLSPVEFSVMHKMPLFDLFSVAVKQLSTYSTFVPFVVVLISALCLNYTVNYHDLLDKRTSLPMLLYAILMSSSKSTLLMHPVIFANFFLILSFFRIIGVYRVEGAYSNVFDAAFFVAMASLCYFPCIVLLPVIFISIILFHSFNWREWVMALLGFIVPYCFALTYYFYVDKLDFFWFDKIVFPIVYGSDAIVSSTSSFVLMGVLLFIITFSLVKSFEVFSSSTVKTRKTIVFFLWFTLFGFVAAFISPTWSFKDFSILAIPFSVFISNYFINITRDWMAEALFFMLFSCIIYVQYIA